MGLKESDTTELLKWTELKGAEKKGYALGVKKSFLEKMRVRINNWESL